MKPTLIKATSQYQHLTAHHSGTAAARVDPAPSLSVHNLVSDYLPTCALPDSPTALYMDDSAAYGPGFSDSPHPGYDLAYYSEGGCYHGGNFAAGVEQPPVWVAAGDEMVMGVVVLGDRDDGVEWKRLKLIQAPHERGAFGDGWEWVRMVPLEGGL